jgi:hypothetical protein
MIQWVTRTRRECRDVVVVAALSGIELGTEASSGTCADPNVDILALLLVQLIRLDYVWGARTIR